MRDLIVFEKLPCANWQEGRTDGPCLWADDTPTSGISCVGCQGDGSRLVRVGTLRHFRSHKYPQEGAYGAGTFAGFVDDEADLYGWCSDGTYQPLYVIEEAPDAG